VALGFELRVLRLLGRCSITCTSVAALFALVIFETWSCFIARPAWARSLLCEPHCVARMTGVHHCVQSLVEVIAHKLFCPSWPGPPLSAFQVARIIGVSHHTWLKQVFLFLQMLLGHLGVHMQNTVVGSLLTPHLNYDPHG
jgi:hypothetical protein